MSRMNSMQLVVTGSAASLNSPVNVNGELYAVGLAYDGASSTTDVVVSANSQVLLSRANLSTNSVLYPRAAVHGSDGVALVYASTDPVPDRFPINGPVNVSVAGGGSDFVQVAVELFYR